MKKILSFLLAALAIQTGFGQNATIIDPSGANTQIRLNGPISSSPLKKVFSIGGFGRFEVDAPGVEGGRFTILENGRVGIGISSPDNYGHGGTNRILEIHNDGISANSQAHLMLSSNTYSNGSLGNLNFVARNVPWADKRMAMIGSSVDIQSTTGGGNLYFWTNNAGTFSQKMIISKDGNVGIGTSSPSVTLDIKRNSTGAAHLRLTGLNESYMEFYPDNALPTTRWGYLGYSQPDVNNLKIDNQRNGNMVFNNNGLTRMIISNTGNIITDVGSNNSGSVSFNAIKFGGESSGEGIASKGTAGGNQFGLDFYTNSQNRLAIKNNGYVGIGLSSPEHKLTISDPVAAFSAYQVTGVTGNLFNDGLIVGYNAAGAFVYNYENTDLHFATNNNVRMKITAAGNLEFEGTNRIVNEAFINVNFSTPPLGVAWQNSGGGAATAQYYKDKEGRVHLKGMICCGTSTSGTTIFVLPTGYAPLAGELLTFPVLVANGGSMGAIRIEGSGAVKILHNPVNTYISLDGISFRAE